MSIDPAANYLVVEEAGPGTAPIIVAGLGDEHEARARAEQFDAEDTLTGRPTRHYVCRAVPVPGVEPLPVPDLLFRALYDATPAAARPDDTDLPPLRPINPADPLGLGTPTRADLAVFASFLPGAPEQNLYGGDAA